jgi:hypothetical protein
LTQSLAALTIETFVIPPELVASTERSSTPAFCSSVDAHQTASVWLAHCASCRTRWDTADYTCTRPVIGATGV